MEKIFMESRMPRALMALVVALSLWAMSLASGGGTSAFAAAAVTVGGKAIVANTGGSLIRIRVDAGTEFTQIAVASGGQSVSVLAGPRNDKGGKQWFKVQAPGGTGWMSGDFLQAVGAPATAPATASGLTGSAIVANTGTDPLRMRATASVKAQVLTLLGAGSTVSIQAGPLTDDTGIAWYAVSANGYSGWAMAQYLAQAPVAVVAATNKDSVPQAVPAVAVKPAVTAVPATVSPTAIPAVAAHTAVPTQKPAAPQPPQAVPAVAVVATPVAQTQSVAPSGPGQYRQWMQEARALYPYNQSVDKMWSVMMCESGGNARASNGGRYLGLFQYAPATWAGTWNPYRGSSVWDAKSQIFATAKAWSIGMQGSWSCYYSTPGR